MQKFIRAPLAVAVSLMAAQVTAQTQEKSTPVIEEVIVTGVFSSTTLREAPVAVSQIDESMIRQSGTFSAADLLKNVPGVFVNSSLGEIRNTVYSRGVAAGSNEAASGYFYVSMQEDSLPVSNVTFSNFGPDYFLRADATLGSLEALRGGTSVIAGPNAPGGIFNYISKTGKSAPGGSVALRTGLEGDGRNPFHRIDAYYGGQVSGTDGLYYGIGGFYRSSDGARDPGYTANEGGQIKANLLWEYARGSLQGSVKILDDSNVFFEFLPARGYANPSFAPGISATDSPLPPAAPHSWTDAFGNTATWDGSELVRNEQVALTLNWKHDLSDTISISNDFKYQESSADWNTGAVIFPIPATDIVGFVFANTLGIPGTYRFTDTRSGQTAAEVLSITGFDHTLVTNNLPNPGVLDGGVLTQVAFDPRHEVDEVMNQFKVSWSTESQTLIAGMFYAHADVFRTQSGGGLGFSGIEGNPSLYDVSVTTPDGTTFQVTSPAGFAAVGDALGGGNVIDGEQEQVSFFVAQTLNINDRLKLDWGVRYEDIEYDFNNALAVPVPTPEILTGGGAAGVDGNPLTLYDNYIPTLGQPLPAERNFDYFGYSGSLIYDFTDELIVYARYSRGEKAPDVNFMIGIDNEQEAENLFQDPQVIKQFEIGLRYNTDGLSLSVFPFWSELSNIGDTQLFSDENGQTYTPPPVLGTTTTIGVETEVSWDISSTLNLQANATLQSADSEDFAVWVANGPPQSDDVLVETPDGDADNIPNLMGRATLNYSPTDHLSGFLTWTYMGDRPANRNNAFELPAFSIVDAGAQFALSDAITVGAEIRNVLNEETGIMSWGPTGGLLASLNRQALTPAQVAADPNGLLNVIAAPPRSFFVTLTYDF